MKGSHIQSIQFDTRIKISKLDSARRQLETSIALYFNSGDPVSTHTLAAAAREILDDINSHRGGSPMADDVRATSIVKPEHYALLESKYREAQNFFKHADRDPEGTLDFNPEATAFYVFSAVEKYRELTGENPPYFRVFSLWFRTMWPEVFIFTDEERRVFSMVGNAYRADQKAKFFADFLPRYAASATAPVKNQST